MNVSSRDSLPKLWVFLWNDALLFSGYRRTRKSHDQEFRRLSFCSSFYRVPDSSTFRTAFGGVSTPWTRGDDGCVFLLKVTERRVSRVVVSVTLVVNR